MTKVQRADGVDATKRRLIKSSLLLGGALAAGRAPYASPEVKSFLGAGAFAQTTFIYTMACTATPSPPAPSGSNYVCADGELINIAATVSPIPPVGTLIQCLPTTTDPNNPSGFPDQAPTDAFGVANFIDFDVFGGFPSPPVADGQVIMMTATFVDQATFGLFTWQSDWVVETCA